MTAARAPHGSLKATCLPLMDGTRSAAEVAAETGAHPAYVRALSQRAAAPLKGQTDAKPPPPAGSQSFPCPACGGATRVIDSRPEQLGEIRTIRRRRHCNACADRFTTYELTAEVIEALEARLAEAEAIRSIIRQVTDRVPTIRPRSD